MESEKKFKVLKAFEATKEDGELFFCEEGLLIDAHNLFSTEKVSELIKDGSLEFIVDEKVGDEFNDYDGPMVTVKITGEASSCDENGENETLLEVGSIQTLPKPVADDFIASGVAELFVDESTDAGGNGAALPPETSINQAGDLVPPGSDLAQPEPVKILEGKVVVSDVTREVNDKVYHHIKLEDGSTQDLTDEEYALKVIVQDNG